MATAPQPPDPTWQFISGAGQGIQAFPFASGWLVRGSGVLFFVPGIDPLSGSGTGTASILAAIADLKQTAETLSAFPTQQRRRGHGRHGCHFRHSASRQFPDSNTVKSQAGDRDIHRCVVLQ
jgi:hypothetical protein